MSLRVKILAEPFTDYSKGAEPLLARSDEYRRLYRDLERYSNGQILGRSYLIAGHRGSGKTMLVHKAIEDLLRNSLNESRRPLFVRLHGPDLLPPLKENGASTNGDKKVETKGKNDAKDKTDPTAVAKAAAEATAAKNEDDSDHELKTVLAQMMKALFRAVTNEYRRCYRERILRLDPGLRRERLLELASQFDLELTEAITEAITPSRLRSYWNRIEAFREGILFTADRSSYSTYVSSESERGALSASDIGFQEILVLSFLNQAFQIIAGKIEETQTRKDAAKQELSSTLSTAFALKNLFGPIAGLLTGGFVGIEIGKNNPIAAVLLGLLTGLVVSFAFTYSSTKSKSRETSLESVFIPDRSVATLSSVLPMLVVRLKEIGLAPVFVIDELDKVHDLKARMYNLVRHLKFLVTENSFSCFLTDRRYLTYLNRQANQTAYAPEYTYFSDRLLVLYPPDELRKFVKAIFEYVAPESESESVDLAAQSGQLEEDAEKIAYVVLHRSRLHPIDLRRQIDRLSAKTTFSFADAFPSTQYRFEILMQLAIESFLNSDDVQSQIGGNPDSRQVVYDALYYVSRLWEDASESQRMDGFEFIEVGQEEKKPGFILDKAQFSKYLESRCAEEAEPGQPCRPDEQNAAADLLKGLSGLDFDFLFEKVSDLVNVLVTPQKFYGSLRASKNVPAYIQNALPLQTLIKKVGNTNKYIWLYDFSGRYLQSLDVQPVIRDVEEGIKFIRDTDRDLQTPNDTSLQALAVLKVIPRTPDWASVKTALDRLSRLMVDKRKYTLMSVDHDCIVEFNGTLRDFLPNVKAALMCAGILAREIPGQPVQASSNQAPARPKLSAGLQQVSHFLQLTAFREDDFKKLSSVLKSPLVVSDLTPEDEWDKILGFVQSSLAQTGVRDPAPIVAAAWAIFKERFAQRFREGTARFDPQFEDLFTSIRDVGPGRNLSFDLSTMVASAWTSFLLRALADPRDAQVPKWLRVAAALEMNLPDLADKLTSSLPTESGFKQWVSDFGLRPAKPMGPNRNVLVLSAETDSLTTGWKPSARHGSLVSTVPDFARLLELLKKIDRSKPIDSPIDAVDQNKESATDIVSTAGETDVVSKPSDFPIDLVCVELSGNRTALGKLITKRPAEAIQEMSPTRRGPVTRDIDPFFEIQDVCYLVKEVPSVPSSAPAPLRYVQNPKGIDDLIDRLPPLPVAAS